ncbi:type II transport protein GspH [Shewanella sp. VB17]|uniref:GspH/FimT family pseudopilin n=1 Tax=Shewanella sp. VB17 TaxID=2739432 RepID=UPI0015665B13|nr:GspH/FimT family pseudopilin [Shewanella sp. VB17]NRD72814.1 type II transport protein GspH [Shewanella sp. VB17]
MQKQIGLTLVEAMATLAISTIVISVGVPNFQSLYEYFRCDTSTRKIQQTLKLARNYAISYSSQVTVCPIESNKCSRNWQLGLTIFTDLGEKNTIDGTDNIIHKTGPFSSKDFIIYNRRSIRFQPTGLASGTNGTLRYCPSKINSEYSKAIIISQAGRIRFSKKNNITCGN